MSGSSVREKRERKRKKESISHKPFWKSLWEKTKPKRECTCREGEKKKKDAAAAQEAWVSLYVFFFSACKDKKKFYLSK